MKLEELTGLTPEQKIKALIICDAYCYEKADTNSIDIKSAEELEDLYAELKDSVVPEFKNMKFRVKDAEHSKQIQEYLFSLRYHWRSKVSRVLSTDEKYLFADLGGTLTHCSDHLFFENHEHPEYQLKETKSYSLEEVKPVKSIVTLGINLDVEVTINGEKISLKELKELLNKD